MRNNGAIWISMLLTISGSWAVMAISQDTGHHVIDFVDLPADLLSWEQVHNNGEGWYIEFNETWNISPSGNSLRKTVENYKLHDRNSLLTNEDPHLRESGNIAYSAPDSMDARTRKLQEDLISLLESRIHSGKIYDLHEQLLSVHFHEEWIIDPLTFGTTKRVHGITPVVWQRRQTTAGEPVNDADSELPVYYKIKLDRIDLRNP